MSPRFRRILLRLAIVLVAGVLAAWGGLNLVLQTAWVRNPAQATLTRALGPQATMGRVWWLPWSGFVLRDLDVPALPEAAARGSFLHIDRIELRPDYLALRHKVILPKRVRVVGPVVRVVRGTDGRLLLPFAAPAIQTAQVATASPGTPAVPAAEPFPQIAPPPAPSSPVPLPGAPSGPTTPLPAPPDLVIEVEGAGFEFVDEAGPESRSGHVRGLALRLTPAGGSVRIGPGDMEGPGMRNTRPLEIPLEWHGLELHAPLARMKSGQASLAMTAKASMAEGWPVGLVIEAREAPAAWFVEWTGLDPGERLQGPSVNMDMQAGLLAKAPSVWATTGRTEITAVDVPKPLQQLWQDLQVPGMDSLDGNFRASVQWQGRNGGTDVQQFQVLAGGILLGGRAVVLPGGVVRGQMGVAVAPDVGEAITRLESRLPPELAFHIEAPQEVTLPEGRKESWKGRAVTLTGLLTDLRLALWPGQAPVSPVEIRQAVLSRRLPADPDEIELLPMRNRNR